METTSLLPMNVLVYRDQGVGSLSHSLVIRGLLEDLPPSYSVKSVDHTFFTQEKWEAETALIVFPGGRDLAYHQNLKGEGNRRIALFVERGGAYLGICAGGYYGATAIEFEKGYPLEISGKRELAFFPGKAVGPAYGCNTFRYESQIGSRLAQLKWVGTASPPPTSYHLYYNGGCRFLNPEEYPEVTVLARYEDLKEAPAAVVYCKVGEGRAILSGVHPECSAEALYSLDPYSKPLIPLLAARETERRDFWRKLLSSLINI